MAIFFPPPPPFVGGSQPFAGHNGNVPSENVQVDNPPPSRPSLIAVIIAAALAWQPGPPDPFQGGRQPTAPRQLPPSLLGPRVDNPPLGGSASQEPQFQTVLAAWQPPPPNAYFGAAQPLQPKALAPSLLDVRVDSPPPGGSPSQEPQFQTVVTAWQPPPPNAYFGAAQALQPKALPPSLLAVRVDNPPGLPDQLPPSFWQADPVPAQRYARLVIVAPATFVASSADVQFATILSAWQPAEFRPISPRQLSPSILNVRVDNPPGLAAVPPAVLGAWSVVAPQTVGPVLSAAWVAPVAGTPFAPLPLAILAAWQAPAPAPVLPRALPPSLLDVRVDNPPGIVPQPASAWQPVAPPTMPVRSGIAPLLTVAAPAVQTPYAALPPAILSAWAAPDPAPTLPRKLPAIITAVRVDNPPGINLVALAISTAWTQPAQATITARPSLAWQTTAPSGTPFAPLPSSILTAWTTSDPAPTLPRKLPVAITAVRVDNPPGATPQINLANWPTPSMPVLASRMAPGLLAPRSGQPLANVMPQAILAAWQPPPFTIPAARRLSPTVLNVRVDRAPGITRQPDPVHWQTVPPALVITRVTLALSPAVQPLPPRTIRVPHVNRAFTETATHTVLAPNTDRALSISANSRTILVPPTKSVERM